MKVYKFGGASVKDAGGIRNLCAIVKGNAQETLIVVVSAIGKTTNRLEEVVKAWFQGKSDARYIVEKLKDAHFEIYRDLFPDGNENLEKVLQEEFNTLSKMLDTPPTEDFDKLYDSIVSIGEIWSTQLVHAYCAEEGVNGKWMDARKIIKTDTIFRNANVDLRATSQECQTILSSTLKTSQVIFVQGFIGANDNGNVTTLGREGSDYSAAIFAYCTNAESVTIWKDVPGVLNADPKWFSSTQKIESLTYQDAIELSYYGATVIHPKTIKPLQNKKIPLYVKSFLHAGEAGTVIGEVNRHLPIPSFIFKVNQVLITLSPRDFSFIGEENLSHIFAGFHSYGLPANVMQLSAISFSICTDWQEEKIRKLISDFNHKYKVLYNQDVELVTIRYYDQATIDRVCLQKQVLLEQKSRYTVQLVVRNGS